MQAISFLFTVAWHGWIVVRGGVAYYSIPNPGTLHTMQVMCAQAQTVGLSFVHLFHTASIWVKVPLVPGT